MKYCYVILLKKQPHNMVVESGHLPIFWRKDIAMERAMQLPKTFVKRISLNELAFLIKSDNSNTIKYHTTNKP